MAPGLSPSRSFLQKRCYFAGHTPGQSAETMPAEGSHWWWHGWRGFRSFHGWHWSVCFKWFRPAGKATKCLKAKLGGSGILNWVQPMDLTNNSSTCSLPDCREVRQFLTMDRWSNKSLLGSIYIVDCLACFLSRKLKGFQSQKTFSQLKVWSSWWSLSQRTRCSLIKMFELVPCKLRVWTSWERWLGNWHFICLLEGQHVSKLASHSETLDILMSTLLQNDGWILQNIAKKKRLGIGWMSCGRDWETTSTMDLSLASTNPSYLCQWFPLLWSWEWSSSTPRNTESYPQINCHKAKQSWEDWKLKCLRWWTQTILSWLHRRPPPQKTANQRLVWEVCKRGIS